MRSGKRCSHWRNSAQPSFQRSAIIYQQERLGLCLEREADDRELMAENMKADG